jgi:uncharacterized membrane protein
MEPEGPSDEHSSQHVKATSNPQVEIARLQDKIVQMEKDLKAKVDALQRCND